MEYEEIQRSQTCEKDSPRCVLETATSEDSRAFERPGSPRSSNGSCSGNSSPDHNGEKGSLKGVSCSSSSSVPHAYGIPSLKGVFGPSGRRRSQGRRFSTSSIPMLWNCELTAKSIRQKLARMWTADAVRKPSWRNFNHSEIEAATDNFCPDGTLVAVKRIIKKDDNEDARTADFLAELGILAHVDHPNAAKLIGFGLDGGLYLILQYASNGSVESHLQGPCFLNGDRSPNINSDFSLQFTGISPPGNGKMQFKPETD